MTEFAPLKPSKPESLLADFGQIWTCCSPHYYLIFGTKKPCVAITSRFSVLFHNLTGLNGPGFESQSGHFLDLL